jgi:hypothetical protein
MPDKMKINYVSVLNSISIILLITGFASPDLHAINSNAGKGTDQHISPLIYINTGIENGSKINWEIKDDGIIYIDLPYDYERATLNRAFDHLHFLLEAPKGSDITMIFQNFNEIYNGEPIKFRDWNTDIVISENGKKWEHQKVEWIEGTRMKVKLHMPSDSLYIARVEPYRLSNLQSLISRIRKEKNVRVIPIGKSVEGRTLEIIQIGKENTSHSVFIRGRVHPWEPGSNWVIEGLINSLMENKKTSGNYLKNYTLYILPMANIDGVAHGITRFNMNGMDLNRDLTKPADPRLSPENAAMEKWLENMISKGFKPDLAIDFHNDAGGKIIFSGSGKESAKYLSHMKVLENLLTTQTWFREGSTFGSGTSFEEGLYKRYGIDALVYELNAYWIRGLQKPPLSEDWKLLGSQMGQVLDEYFRTIDIKANEK